jgi:hypothetical protein
MITPNKVVALGDSSLALSTLILKRAPDPIPMADLYEDLADNFESIDQFLLTLDFLFVMNRVQVDMDEGVLRYVG